MLTNTDRNAHLFLPHCFHLKCNTSLCTLPHTLYIWLFWLNRSQSVKHLEVKSFCGSPGWKLLQLTWENFEIAYAELLGVDVRQNRDRVTRRAVDWWESKHSDASHYMYVWEARWRGEVDIKLSELVNMNSLKLMLRLLGIESVHGRDLKIQFKKSV